jgi:hypothetical protein
MRDILCEKLFSLLTSSAPGGYGFARLAEDVLRVMDAVGVDNPVR